MKALALAVVCLVAACANDPGSEVGAPRETIVDRRLLLVGEIVEGELVGGPADQAMITLGAASPTLDWNLHGHAGGGTQIVEEGFGVMTVEYVFRPTEQAEWLLLVRNADSQPLMFDLELQLHEDMQWSGWQ